MTIDLSRRKFIAALGGAVAGWPLTTHAQQAANIPTVGILWHAGRAEEEGAYFKAMIEGFRDLGYVEGRNLRFEHRFPNEVPDRFKTMAAELVSSKVDVLVGVGVAASLATKNATTTIPVVFTLAADPVASKLVESLARPGGNATGLTYVPVELSGKRLQLLKDMFPALSRVGLLVNPNEPTARGYIAEGEAASVKLGLTQQTFEARTLDEIEPAFDAIERASVQAVVIGPGGLFYQARTHIPKLALARRLPICVWSKETFECGAFMSYGPDLLSIVRGTATYVDKILNGANPAELPVEQPTRLQFLLNLKIAKALDLTVPGKLLSLADEVVE
jgi:putative tryptophan/tyrosine transport system substrate-binding protein